MGSPGRLTPEQEARINELVVDRALSIELSMHPHPVLPDDFLREVRRELAWASLISLERDAARALGDLADPFPPGFSQLLAPDLHRVYRETAIEVDFEPIEGRYDPDMPGTTIESIIARADAIAEDDWSDPTL